VSEPAFLEEWQQADDSAMVIGHWFCAWCYVPIFPIVKSLPSR